MQQEFAAAVLTGGPSLRRSQYPVNGVVDFLHELRSRASTALAIPARSLFSLFDRSGMDNEKRSLAHSAAEESFRRNVSRDTGLTLPESRSSIRRAISSLQAASTASGSSWASSRLSSREPANSARSSAVKGEGTLQQFSGVLRHEIIIRPESGCGPEVAGREKVGGNR